MTAPLQAGPATVASNRRWAILASLFGFSFFGYVERTSIGVAADRMMPELGISQVQIGWMFTAFLVAYTLLQVPTGVLGQRLGPHRMLVISSVLTLLSTLAIIGAPAFLTGGALVFAFVAARALLGVGQAPVYPVSSGAIDVWFPKEQWCLAQALLNVGLDLGAAATPPAIAYVMGVADWKLALLLTSAPLLALTLYWQWFGRDAPAGDAQAPASAAGPAPVAEPVNLRRIAHLMRSRDLIALTLSYLAMEYIFYLLTFWCFLYFVQERHFTAMDSGWLAAFPFVAAAIGSGFGGVANEALARRFGRRWGDRLIPLVALPVAGIALMVAVGIASALGAEVALCVAFAAIESTEGPYWSAAMRVAGADAMAATGLLNAGGNVGGIIGTPLVAALSAQGHWTEAFLTGTACAVAAAALWLMVDTDRD